MAWFSKHRMIVPLTFENISAIFNEITELKTELNQVIENNFGCEPEESRDN
jgi:hypothetical protein